MPDPTLCNLAPNPNSRRSRAREYISAVTHPRVARCTLLNRTVRISRHHLGRENRPDQNKPQLKASVATISAALTAIRRRGPRRITEIYPFERAVFIFRSAKRRILVPCSSTGLARSAKTATSITA